MTKAKTGWLLVGVLCLASFAMAQETAWEKNMKASLQAYQRGQYGEAEKQARAAVQEAEKFGPQDLRLAASLHFQAVVKRVRGDYVEAEPLYQRALVIREKSLGPEHPHVAVSLNHLALLYSAQGKYAEADPLYRRALAIREKALGPKHPDDQTDFLYQP